MPLGAFGFGDLDAATAGASLDLALDGRALSLRQTRRGPLVESSLVINGSVLRAFGDGIGAQRPACAKMM